MSIRKQVVEAMQGEAVRCAIDAHVRGYHRLIVYPSGTVERTEETDDNSWRVIRDTVQPVAIIWSANNGIPCNCAACNDGDDPEAWAADESGEMWDALIAGIGDIPVGYFSDEQKDR